MKLKISRNWVVLGAALTVGGLAAVGTQRYIRAQVDAIEARARHQETVRLVVAKDDLGKGAKLSPDTMAIREVPREWAHSNAITPDQFERAEGATLALPARKGEPVLWAQIEERKAPSFSARLAAGRRAVTVPVDEISSLSGMVEPGDLIDIIVSARKGSRQVTFALLQGVQVLATGTRVSQKSEGGTERGYTTITLDTTPEEAKRVIAAREIGRITALLRAPEDRAAISTERTDASTLLGLGDAPPATPVSTVPVIYGGAPIGEAAMTALQAARTPEIGTRAVPEAGSGPLAVPDAGGAPRAASGLPFSLVPGIERKPGRLSEPRE